MKIKVIDNEIWFNTMPAIGPGRHSLPSIRLALDPEEVLPQGTYVVEVTLKGPDGKEHKAAAHLTVDHVC